MTIALRRELALKTIRKVRINSTNGPQVKKTRALRSSPVNSLNRALEVRLISSNLQSALISAEQGLRRGQIAYPDCLEKSRGVEQNHEITAKY
jgi:hypothetical protein